MVQGSLELYPIALAALTGMIVGWIAASIAGYRRRLRADRQTEKAGIWRCEDRGYYLMAQNRTLHKQPDK